MSAVNIEIHALSEQHAPPDCPPFWFYHNGEKGRCWITPTRTRLGGVRSVFLLWDRQGYLSGPICSSLFPGSEGRLHSPGQQLTSHMTELLPMNYEQKCTFHLTYSRETIWTWTLLFSPFLGWHDQGQGNLGGHVLEMAKLLATRVS